VSRFVENAAKIFEAAESASRSGHSLSDMTILISPGGGIRMVVDSDWPLDSLRMHHGAQMAYRVSQQETSVCVEGRAGWQTCLLKTAKPNGVARLLLGPRSTYPVVHEAQFVEEVPALPSPACRSLPIVRS
jgi:hypothetical protein